MLHIASNSLRQGLRKTPATLVMANRTQVRNMGGGGIKKQTHIRLAETFGTITFLWVFYRASQDLGVVLQQRHPWEH